MRCESYSSELQNIWESFVQDAAWNATFLHTRLFLSYHGSRFEDVSVLVRDEDERVVALFPAAVHPVMKDTVVSHPGATFGGLVAGAQCRGERCITALSEVVAHYRAMGYKRMIYKVTPHIYHQFPFQDDAYALFRLGFLRSRCDISATITSQGRPALTKGRKYEINKARKRGVEIVSGAEVLNELHALIEENLRQAHQAKPVHTITDLSLLAERFPDRVRFMASRLDRDVVAGLVMFNFNNVAHTQYIASNDAGREAGALDMLIEHSINTSLNDGFRYFDFGISNERDGLVLNEGLYRYKRTFGAGSVVHEFYELEL